MVGVERVDKTTANAIRAGTVLSTISQAVSEREFGCPCTVSAAHPRPVLTACNESHTHDISSIHHAGT